MVEVQEGSSEEIWGAQMCRDAYHPNENIFKFRR
jgi:hypothetical protein